MTPEMFAKIAVLREITAANVTLVGSDAGVGAFVDLHFATVAEKLLADFALGNSYHIGYGSELEFVRKYLLHS